MSRYYNKGRDSKLTQTEIDELSSMNRNREALKMKVEEAKNKLSKCREEYYAAGEQDKTKSILAVKEEYNVLKKEHDDLTKDFNALKEDHNVLKEKNNSLKEENNALKKDHNALKAEYNALELVHDDLKTEHNTLKNKKLSFWPLGIFGIVVVLLFWYFPSSRKKQSQEPAPSSNSVSRNEKVGRLTG